MKRLRSLSPNELAIFSATGTVAMASCFVLPLPHLPHSISLSLAAAAVFLLAAITALWCESQLRDGIRSEEWDPTQTARVRRIAESRWLKAITACGFLVFLSGILFDMFRSATGHSLWSTGWAGWLIGMYTLRFSTLFIKPRSNTNPPRLAPRDLKPLQSSHWGQQHS